MLETVRRAFQIEDIRKRLFYTFLMLVVVRLGSQLPTPGVDPTYIQEFFANQTGDAFNFFDAFTGGSFTQMSVFALSITPYITSSIIMQLLTIAIPKLEEMQKEGEDGRKKIAAITRYVTVALALIESIAMAVGFGRQGLLVEYNFVNAAIVVCTLTAGSAFLMWIGERITEKGVGNGISIVLLINIVSRVPDDFVQLYEQFVRGKTIAKGGLAAIIILAVLLVVIVFVIILQGGTGKKDIWRTVHTHPVKSKYFRCYPRYLCILTDAVPDRNRVFPWKGRRHRNRKPDSEGNEFQQLV